MSTIKVTNLRGRNGSPTLPDGAVVTGVATATTFDGSLKTTGTPTLGLGVTINSSGVAISGVLTATTLKGDGSSLTGVGESIAPWYYNPDVNDQLATVDTGIGITFNKLVNMGSGTATLKMVNAGVAGTTIQSWGISSVTKAAVTEFTLGSLVSTLTVDKTYQLDIPEGFVVSSTGTNYAGTAYTFATQAAETKLWAVGHNGNGILGINNTATENYSSPVQVPGTWSGSTGHVGTGDERPDAAYFIKQDGTLWSWGGNSVGKLGQNSPTNSHLSSPTQIGTDTTWKQVSKSYIGCIATKTDGTLWGWGLNEYGQLGQNSIRTPSANGYSSPIQIPGTTWSHAEGGYYYTFGIKTDGTLWTWGYNQHGRLGHNQALAQLAGYSSPVQVPGTTWTAEITGGYTPKAVKTDGTLWTWGSGSYGSTGLNNTTTISSPTQIPGTTWSKLDGGYRYAAHAIKTNGTLWAWGHNDRGMLGQNDLVKHSSPVQIPGTTWSIAKTGTQSAGGIKTDGTLWTWGGNPAGQGGINSVEDRSSPTQVPGTEWINLEISNTTSWFLQDDQSP